ncbi:MAG: carboxypeptidase regulatory-like domain-containing protein [Planctomycetes bacterium]|nr:carboxypeptidase regulatory-like domain-containing protein [Planctomycetota bacterium]
MWNVSFKRVLFTLAVLLMFGCGRGDLPPLAPVKGTITVDGKPYANGFVQFYSQSGGRPGTSPTDDNGKYEIMYLQGVKGARIGMNRVEITTEWPDGEPPIGEVDPIGPEYNSKSTLSAEVKKGNNVFDFNIESQKKPAGK